MCFVCLFVDQRHGSTWDDKGTRMVRNLRGIVFTVSKKRTLYLRALSFFLPVLMLRVIKVRVTALYAPTHFFLLAQVCECLSVVVFQYV